MSVDPVTIVIACLGLLVFLFLYKQQQKRVAGHVSQLAPSKQEGKPRGKKELQAFTREEVAKHCTRDDAWIIVQDKQTGVHKVYDVTPYVDEHPGGESILNNAGRDSTEGFLGPQHPATVFVLAEDFLIGTLAQQ
ncbi:cytochrome b5-like protein [Dunaliella salina]|uniref:Cytochrome b5-like protein n=1 Tax=Dunaliella salina TaxID=3046 RepID=A0ABQ7GQZ5_DUNSA|nr:cytochrome b5-like protein [Dunaliella salina]|eukprot:KAF5837033.1 cytochrome b5-like protein [Dunaliella salina]